MIPDRPVRVTPPERVRLLANYLAAHHSPLRGTPRTGWLAVLLRRTVVLVFLLCVVLVVVGAALERYAPGAVSIGGVLAHWRTTR